MYVKEGNKNWHVYHLFVLCSTEVFHFFFFFTFVKNSFESFFLVVDVFCEEKVHGQESVSPRAVGGTKVCFTNHAWKCPDL